MGCDIGAGSLGICLNKDSLGEKPTKSGTVRTGESAGGLSGLT